MPSERKSRTTLSKARSRIVGGRRMQVLSTTFIAKSIARMRGGKNCESSSDKLFVKRALSRLYQLELWLCCPDIFTHYINAFLHTGRSFTSNAGWDRQRATKYKDTTVRIWTWESPLNLFKERAWSNTWEIKCHFTKIVICMKCLNCGRSPEWGPRTTRTRSFETDREEPSSRHWTR
jgi:hypothetical protein